MDIVDAELDRTRFAYYTEESETLKNAYRAEEAELKAKGKKKDMMSMFQSKTALEKQADKLSAKQEELHIKSTGLLQYVKTFFILPILISRR